jgi:protoheme ferro-lyase
MNSKHIQAKHNNKGHQPLQVTQRQYKQLQQLQQQNEKLNMLLNSFYWNPGQPRTLLQLNLVGILMINLFLTYYTTSVIKSKIHPLNHLVF